MGGDAVIHHGDCLDVMAGMEPESIDAIVTDPPYGLEFMGKEWDRLGGAGFHAPKDEGRTFTNASGHKSLPRFGRGAGMQAFHARWAEAAYRVAKPSAYLLAFGGTRTVHRMTVALEDAGWIIRDMLVWGYACLSDDTELLTSEGWVPYNRANVGQLAASFDPDSGELRWSSIEAVHVYHHDGDMAEVGPSLVTLNHRLVIDQATARVPRVPGLREPLYQTVGVGQEGSRAGLLEGVQRQASDPGSEVPPWPTVVRGPEGARVRGYDGSRELGLEGRRYRVQEAWELLGSPLRAEPGVGAPDGPQGRVRDGAPAGRGGPGWLPADPDRVRQPRGPRPDEQRPGEPDPLAGQPDAQAVRVGQVPDRDSEPDSVRIIFGYAGPVWCITVATGAFVARRNGVPFVTGNSGFPKSKASLKPAWEPVVMARKPGPLRMLAIDECRIGVDGGTTRSHQAEYGESGWRTGHDILPVEGGRWPANIVLTDPIFDGGWEGVVGGGEASVSPSDITTPNRTTDREGWSGLPYNERVFGYGDSGTYSRFFLIPKAARSDREPVDPSYSYRLHRERGECSKLSAWDSADQRLADRMDSTSPARATSEATSADDSSSDTSQHGSPSTDPSPTDTKSTTSTATSRTTGSRTSSSSVPLPTSASTRAASSETASGGSPAPYVESSSLWGSPTGISVVRGGRSTDDAGPVISPSSSSRNACVVCGRPLPRFSTHPTQKPTDLMRHLVRLVTPTGGVVLDPFLGSGTTALAAEMEGFDWIGIEREAEYVAIAEARLNGTQRGLGLESA